MSEWVDFTVDSVPQSELVLDKAFEIQALDTATYTVTLNQNDTVTINGAISQHNSNRSIGATIDFIITDGVQVYHSYKDTSTVTLSWTVPRSGNYSFVFNNTSDDAAKDVIIMATRSWQVPQQHRMLVTTRLVPNLYLRAGVLIGGVVLFALGVSLVVSGLRKNNAAPTPQ